MRKSLMLTVAAAGLLAAASSAVAAGTWVPANVPKGGSNFSVFGINNSDIVVGQYNDSGGTLQGVFGPFDGSDYTKLGGDEPRGISNMDFIVGFDTATLQQWERSPKGKLKPITLDGQPVSGVVQGINTPGTFVGSYASENIDTAALGRKYKYVKVIKLKIDNTGCAARAIDDARDVGGWYFDSSGIQHGFVSLAGQKRPVMIDYPNANYTVVEGMNNKGIVSGQWEDAKGVIHGFLYDISKKTYTSLDAPGASFTQVWGLNDAGVVVASAAESSGTGSFAYCMQSTGCPGAGAAAANNHPRAFRKAVPLPN